MIDGLHTLADLRVNGYVPQMGVLIYVGGVRPHDLGNSEHEQSGAMVIAHVPDDADVSATDWRAVRGLKCLVLVDPHRRDQRLGRAVCMALVGAKARRVVGFVDSLEQSIETRPLSAAFFDYSEEVKREPANA